MKKTHLILISVLVAVILLALCLKIGFIFGEKSMETKVAQYKEVIDYHTPISEEIFVISGKITEIKNDVVNLETIIQDPYVLPDEWESKTFKVNITDETKILKFDDVMGESKEINLSDIKVGDRINVRSEENIKDKTEFEASSVELFAIPEIPE